MFGCEHESHQQIVSPPVEVTSPLPTPHRKKHYQELIIPFDMSSRNVDDVLSSVKKELERRQRILTPDFDQ